MLYYICIILRVFVDFLNKKLGVVKMFKITGSAAQVLLNIVDAEKNSPEEELFVRITMGIG